MFCDTEEEERGSAEELGESIQYAVTHGFPFGGEDLGRTRKASAGWRDEVVNCNRRIGGCREVVELNITLVTSFEPSRYSEGTDEVANESAARGI